MSEIKLGQWALQEIQLKDGPLYAEFIKNSQYQANLWSSNFAYIWARARNSSVEKVLWRQVKGMLVTFIYTRSGLLQLPCLPFGPGDSKRVQEVLLETLNYCHEINGRNKRKTNVRVVSEEQLEFLKAEQDFNLRFRFKQIKGIDKHVKIQELITLEGSKYAKVRQSVNSFKREFPKAVIRRYEPVDSEALIKLKQHWNETAGKKYSYIHDEGYYKEVIKHYKELDHLILVVELEGIIIGMIYGGILPTGESWVFLVKAMNHVKGLSEVLHVEFAREINGIDPSVLLMNLGVDIGVKGGLRYFKDKFGPVNSKRYRLYLK